jgi:hypothetical protein
LLQHHIRLQDLTVLNQQVGAVSLVSVRSLDHRKVCPPQLSAEVVIVVLDFNNDPVLILVLELCALHHFTSCKETIFAMQA